MRVHHEIDRIKSKQQAEMSSSDSLEGPGASDRVSAPAPKTGGDGAAAAAAAAATGGATGSADVGGSEDGKFVFQATGGPGSDSAATTEFLKGLISAPVSDTVLNDADGVVPPAASFKIPSPVEVRNSILKSKSKTKQVLKASGEEEVSEKIKEHLGAIATALVDDMTQDLRKEVCKDPRMQARCIKPRRQLEKEIIRKYQQEMSEKRKDKLSVYNFATTTALSGLSAKAYAAIRSALGKMGARGVLPTVTALRQARKELEEISFEDMGVYATPDGWFVWARAAVESEILRLMQVVGDGKGTRKESGGRVVGIRPDGHGWQDRYHVKIQLDARRITRRTSQTEVMLLIIPKGEEGVDRCQKAVYQRTIGIWTGKDSRDNVQANMRLFFAEIECLQTNGVVYDPTLDSLLGVCKGIQEKGVSEDSPAWKEQQLRRVGLDFWLGADMAAQCAVLGHGCAGNEYCAHCTAHRNNRHIPYELIRLEKAVSFQRLAEDHDMFPHSLYAINAGLQGMGGETEHGLRSCTADATFQEEEEEEEEEQEQEQGGEEAGDKQPGAGSGLGHKGASRKTRGRAKTRKVLSTCKGPHIALLGRLTGWKEPAKHALDCPCTKCVVPAGTVVRVIPCHGDSDWRRSDWLSTVWPSHNRKRFPFCALHCLMRITEAMFMMITQRCLKNERVIDKLNAGLEKAGICKKFSKIAGASGVHTYEKLTFEGHQALKLLAEDSEGGKLAVTHILEAMWPKGDADGEGGRNYVPRVAALWTQWSKVVNIMKERDPAKVRDIDGFARFGKECREFCRLYQAMYHEQHCRSFYLHTLMHHAGDFMRELEGQGMCLGMMSNSGVERRHEYGRRAAKKALAGGCWKAKVPGLVGKENLFAYLTLKEVLIWQHGTDLVSHELARRAAESGKGGPNRARVLSRSALNHSPQDSDSAPAEPTARALHVPAAQAADTEPSADSRMQEDYADTLRAVEEIADISDELTSTTPCSDDSETGRVEFEGQLDGDRLPAGVRKEVDGRLTYIADGDTDLFRGRDELCGVLEQESVAGSDEFEDENAEEMARRINDLNDLRGDWLPEQDEEDGDFQMPADADSSCDEAPDGTDSDSIALSRVARRRMPPAAAPAVRSGSAGPAVRAAAHPSPHLPVADDAPLTAKARGTPSASAAGAGAGSTQRWTWDELKVMQVPKLKTMCRGLGIQVSNLRKEHLIRLLVKVRADSESAPAPQQP